MSGFLAIYFCLNFMFVVISYLYLYKKRKHIGFHLGMNIAMVAGGGIAIGTGVILINQFPLHFIEITIISTLTGMGVGSLFGGLFDYQTLLTGYINGLLMGFMAPMVGAAASDSLFFISFLELFLFGSFLALIVVTKNS